MKKLPKSGSWLNSVKVVMGFLELAAAIKFFRAGELVILPQPDFFTYDLVLGLYIAICLLCGLYLLGLYRLPHDYAVGAPRRAAAALQPGFLGLGFYLLPALFKHGEGGKAQRPNGSDVCLAGLLPAARAERKDLAWSGNLEQAIAEARRNRASWSSWISPARPAPTARSTNATSSPSRTIKELLQQYKLVQLYTDKVPDEFYPSAIAREFGSGTTRQQRQDAACQSVVPETAFNTEQLPLYVILAPARTAKSTWPVSTTKARSTTSRPSCSS